MIIYPSNIMQYIKKHLKDKSGNNFLIGLLVIFACIGLGTIFLTYKDFKATTILINDSTIYSNSSVIESSIILANNNKDDNYKSDIKFGTIGNATIIEEAYAANKVTYKCLIKLNDKTSYIKISITNDIEQVDFVNENGELIESESQIPLAFYDYIVNLTKIMYKQRIQ